MRSTRITAALVAASMIPLSASGFIPTAITAVCAADTVSVPDWVPSDFKSAQDFRNTYGTTHIDTNLNENDTVCVVFNILFDKEDEYTIGSSDPDLKLISRETYTDETTGMRYETAAFTRTHQDAGLVSFDISLYHNDRAEMSYYFESYGDNAIAETDIYSWMPDCDNEYSDFVNANGEVSTKDNYVVLCLEAEENSYCKWFSGIDRLNTDVMRYVDTADCSAESTDQSSGGWRKMAVAYEAVGDGKAQIEYNYAPPEVDGGFSYDKVKKRLEAVCEVQNDGKTILLSDMVRFKFVDADTGELLPDIKAKLKVYRDKKYTSDLIINENSCIWRDSKHKETFYLDFEMAEEDVPYGYTLPEDHISVTKYYNGAMEVVLKLKKDENCLEAGTTRVTLYDRDTGEVIPSEILKNHAWSFGTDIHIKKDDEPGGWLTTGPVYIVSSASQIIKGELASLYREADVFKFLCNAQPTVKVYDNGSMDLSFNVKLEASGDANDDGDFSVADLVMLDKWLHSDGKAKLSNWINADVCIDNSIDVFDLCVMRKKLLSRMEAVGYDFEAQYIRTNRIGGSDEYPMTELIESRSELEKYISSKEINYSMDGVSEAAEKYTDEWFSDHKLLVVVLEEGSGSNRHEVAGLTKDNVTITRIVPQVGTCDMAEWHILVETDSNFEMNDYFTVNVVNGNMYHYE
ncbi:MAG: dockerin type I repeat-containing protein [Ruminococcus sp.]|nr:dockerin type I repeat-containing protein [Ruminococcus sp.]